MNGEFLMIKESIIIIVPERSSPFVPPAMRFLYVTYFPGSMIFYKALPGNEGR